MKPTSQPNDRDRQSDRQLEQMVAYLDGELSPTEQALVERQLAEDPRFLRELQGIERAWSALDALPAVKLGDKFSQTTLELVVGAAREEVAAQTRALPVLRRQRAVGKWLCITASAMLGILVVRLVREDPNRRLVEELPVVNYLDVYTQFREVQFLRDLHEGMKGIPWASDLSEGEFKDRISEFERVGVSENRRQWLEELTDEQRSVVRDRYHRYLVLSDSEQTRLQDLHESIVMASDEEQLVGTMLQYQQWINSLPESQQFELRELPPEERVERIVQLQRREGASLSIELTPEELRKLRETLMAIRERLLENLPPQERAKFNQPNAPGRLMALARDYPQERERWRAAVVKLLPADKREQFEALEPVQQQRQLFQWMREIWIQSPLNRPPGERRRFDEMSQEELERFFVEEIDAARKQQLLAQPRERMEQQLKREYLRGEFQPGGEFLPEGGFYPEPRGTYRGGFGPPRRGPGPPEGRPRFDRPPPRGEGPFQDTPPPPPDGEVRPAYEE